MTDTYKENIMLNRIWKVLALAALLLLVAACGGGEEEPTAVPPTAVPPTAVPQPTAVPDPTAGFTSYNSEAFGITIKHPAGWAVEDDPVAGLTLASDADLINIDSTDADEGAVLSMFAFEREFLTFLAEEGQDMSKPLDVLTVLSGLFLSEEGGFTPTGTPSTLDLGGFPSAVLSFTGDSDTGVTLLGNFYIVMQEVRVLIILSVTPEKSQAEYSPILEAMLGTLELSEPAVVEQPEEPVVEEPVVEEPVVEEEPVVVVPVGGGAAVAPPPVPTTTVWPSGSYIFSNANPTRDAVIYNGQIWTASPGGLVAYDMETGSGRKYTPLDGLPDIGNFAVTVCPVNGEERLIVGNRRGILLYDEATDGWESGTTIGFAEDRSISKMICDADNGRLIFNHADVSILDLATGTLTSYTERENGLAWFSTTSFIAIGTDVWATTSRGASRIANDGTITVYSEANGNALDDSIYDIAQGPDGTLWFASSDGLFQLQSNGEYVTFNKDNSSAISFFGPSHIEFSPNGDMWLGFTSDICRFDPATGNCFENYSTYSDPNLPSQARVSSLKLDADGNPYVSFDNGVAHFDGTAWKSYSLPNEAPHNFYSGLFQTSDGTIWIWGEGLYKTDVDVTGWERFADVFPNDMVEAADGRLWFASGSGIQVFNGQQLLKYDRYAADTEILAISYNAIEIDGDGRVYAGGDKGYVIIDGDEITKVGEADGWDKGNIRDLLFADGVMYAATTEGLLQLDGQTWIVLLDATFVELPNKNISSLALYPDGAIVLGTGTGLAYYQNGAVRKDPVVTGSISDVMVQPDTGEVFVTAFRTNSFFGSGGDDNNGLFYYNGVDSWTRFTVADGLPMESFRGVLVDNAGTIWVATGDSGLGGGLFRLVP
jgi:ligand-binding sensor domain-containing protein